MPICLASSSSRFSLAPATSFASCNSLAVGKPDIFLFSSASYRSRLSRGDKCEMTVDGCKYSASTSLCSVCVKIAGAEMTVDSIACERRVARTFERIVDGQLRYNIRWAEFAMIQD